MAVLTSIGCLYKDRPMLALLVLSLTSAMAFNSDDSSIIHHSGNGGLDDDTIDDEDGDITGGDVNVNYVSAVTDIGDTGGGDTGEKDDDASETDKDDDFTDVDVDVNDVGWHSGVGDSACDTDKDSAVAGGDVDVNDVGIDSDSENAVDGDATGEREDDAYDVQGGETVYKDDNVIVTTKGSTCSNSTGDGKTGGGDSPVMKVKMLLVVVVITVFNAFGGW